MLTIPNYQTLAQIYESANSLVYRGLREADNQPVILKLLKEDYPTPEELFRYRQEYDITRRLENVDGVIKAYSLEKHQNTLVMCLEDFGGKSLQIWRAEYSFTQDELLTLAIQMADILGQIHQHNIIHKDINPSNIVWNPTSGVLKIIDLSISTQLSRETPTLKNPNVLEGTLAYLSPEQTGRMNRVLDYRTDFYSLGVTFYELFTRTLPFKTTDAMELVHCHIAKQPPRPDQVNPEIPRAVSDIIMKLLAKTAEERYQSAWGIKADLEEFQARLARKQLESFPLGQQDFSDRFKIPQKLYGREKEIETLLVAFERIGASGVGEGGIEIMLVAGYSGVGKSALVQEIYKPITQKRGYFISGKFDQFQRNVPYSAIVGAFADLVRQLLTESEAQLAQWQEKILTAVGPNGQVIIEVIPEVELIVGTQPPVPTLGSTETQNRFNLVFQNFIKVFTQAEHPLVMFLDDLQWIDSASLKLMQLLVTATEKQVLFLIGAYRDNEVSATHPLVLTLEEIQQANAVVNYIFLSPLELHHVNQLVTDALHCSTEPAYPLAELVHTKTGGNPFFMNEFLKSLYVEGLLRFDFEKAGWQWDLQQIQARGFTDNVVELMADKIKQLPPNTQQVLKLAACIGNQFDLATLAVVAEQTRQETAYQLREAIINGQLSIVNTQSPTEIELSTDNWSLITECKFVHDRIQQAAYSLIPKEQKQVVHQQIGQLLLQNTPLNEREQKIFAIVDQLNVSIELMAQQSERDELAELNLIAGRKAKASAAYKPAFDYFKIGFGLLTEESWQTQYELTLALYVEAVEAAYLNGHFEQMEQLAELVLRQAKTVLDSITIYEIKIQAGMAQNQPRVALKHGLDALKFLEVEFNDNPSQEEIMRDFQETQITLKEKPIETLRDLPPMTNAAKRATMRILMSMISPTFQSQPEIFPLLLSKMLQLSFEYGIAPESPVAYGYYGTVSGGIGGYFEQGYQFAQLALNSLEKLNAREFKTKTYNAVFACVLIWNVSLRETLKPLLDGYQTGLETGDLEFGCYNALYYCMHSYFIGRELAGLEKEIAAYTETATQFKQRNTVNFKKIIWQSVLNLMGKSNHPCQLIGDAYNEINSLPQHQQANDKYALGSLFLHKLILNYLFHSNTQAVENAKMVELSLDGLFSVIPFAIFHFYDSLARLAVYSDSSLQEQESILDKVAANQEKMQNWATHAPMNFLHKFYLVEAERCRVLDKDGEAREYYDKAIELAQEHEYLNEEALAHELAGQFYLAKDLPKLAQVYLREAHYAYQQWGALAKVKDLEERYPQFLAPKTSRVPVQSTVMTMPPGTLMASHSHVTQTTSLDFSSVVKASQTLSGEIVLGRLLEKMMQIVIENAGAEKGFLLLPKGDNWFIEAQGYVNSADVTVLQSIMVEKSENVSTNIIHYVARTQENVVLDNATLEGQFTRDPYIVKQQSKSVLCAPLLNQGQLTGILYLENNLTTGTFTQDRLEVLNLLSSQAAISIENSILYNGLEQKVAERTCDLEMEIVERKRAEDAAKVANQAKSTFLANMSHELRTPLNAILGFAQIMQRSHSLGSEHQDNVQIINRSGEYLLSLINDVLDMSKIEAGKITLNEHNFDLHRLLDEVHDMFYLRAENKHLQLRIERSDEVARYIRTDGTKLRQVLINLLGNALKFTQEGGIYLSVEEISTSPLSKGEMASKTGVDTEEISLSFRVQDTGAGVAPEELDKLFEAFTQTASGRAAQEGTGLGLPISRKFVQLMGGDISVQSQVGNGTVFQFTIHAFVVSAAEIASKQRPQRQVIALEPNQPRYRILIVDDKLDNRQLLIKLLNPLGFELREASTGQEAVDICDKWQPLFIWMDIRMPVMDGLQATQQIKATPTGKEVAIVALTASTLEEEKTVALSAGCDDFLQKPFRDTDIFDMMHKFIGVRY
ncbi:MAG: hypothetical protein DRR19_19320, partial [Candidatus Parabeggiatoa sp. nov. 1]